MVQQTTTTNPSYTTTTASSCPNLYLLKDKEGYNWCPNKTDDPDTDLIRDCEWYAVKTNADRIRAMTNEELAVFLGNTKAFCCRDRDPSEEFIAEFKTWLKEEAEE